MKKSRLLGAVCALSMFTSLSTFASPWGTEYGVLLDGILPSGELEGHYGFVPFDGDPDIVPNDMFPPLPPLPGNDLFVTENAAPNPDGSETISIWIESAGNNCLTLFCNTLDPLSTVFFDIEELYWFEEFEVPVAAVISDIEVLTTFFPGDPGTPITPLFTDIFGSGSFDDPLFLEMGLDPLDLVDATDLHLNFTVSHVPVPAAVWLFGSGLLGLVGMARRKKA